jgi:cytochrome bd-type quinol oxidase subunit 2
MLLREWETFFFIVGSSAAALTGLQFVVIALGAQANITHDQEAVHAFATPNIVHFCGVLTIAALMTVPGLTASALATVLVVFGLIGVLYVTMVALRARRQTGYEPVLEDWLWHACFPMLSYAALLITGIATYRHAGGALYFVAALTMILLFIGIHNAWDSAVYISTRGRE